MKLKKRYLFAIAGVIIAIVACMGIFKTAAKEKYETKTLKRCTITQYVEASGTINPVNTVSVGSTVSGLIKAIYVDYNSEVKKGQLLAQIDPANFEAQVQQNQAQILNAQANLAKLQAVTDFDQKQYQRYKNLYAMRFDFTDIEIGKKTLTDEQLVEAVDTLNGLKIAEKAINALFKKTAVNTITEEQKLVLADYGINGDVYTGIRNVTRDTNAEIELKKVVFKIKGEATIPSVNTVLNKIPTRGVGLKLYEAYKRYEAFTLDQLKAEAKKIAAEIQTAKKILAEERFAYTGENKTIEFNGKTLIIEVADTTRAITQMA
jgi:multidrug efflux pump subunit AcrA (membrane-fusion protein)